MESNKVLAVVGGTEITEVDLKRMIARYPEDRRAYFENEAGKKQLLEQVISYELMSKFGEELGLDKKQDYQDTLKALAKELLTQVTINKVLSEVTVTDEEISNFYNENKKMFVDYATVTAKHILFDSEEKAKEIKDEIANTDLSFEEAARKYSSCPSKEEGGNLGAFKRGMMVPEFEDAAFAAEIGEVTDPVKTQFGYHLILVEDKGESREKAFEEVKDTINNQLLQQASQKKYMDLLSELEGKYGVERK